MAIAVTSFPALAFLALFLAIVFLYLYHSLFLAKYWSKRNVPHLKPVFLFGNTWRAVTFEAIPIVLQKIYDGNRGEKIVGFWSRFNPALMIIDLNLFRRIFIRDFDHFHTRDSSANVKLEPLVKNLFNVNGKEWKELRMKLRPAFSSGKMKMMFPTLMECGDQLRDHLKKPASNREEVGVREVMARFTTDVIGSCGFGIQTNSLENPNSDFRKHGKAVFGTSWKNWLIRFLRNIHPIIVKVLKIRSLSKETSEFFLTVVRDTIAYRKKNDIRRDDFLQLLIQLMDEEGVAGANNDRQSDACPFTETYVAAQCFIFFLAGFETSSTALSYGLYELALHPDIQAKLHKEIDELVMDGEVTYDKICDMKYLDKVVHEILRMHPPGAHISRICTADYHIPEMNLTIEKGTTILTSILGLHYDPKYYPNPEKFDPERFSPEEKGKRDPMSYFPFGEGPRSCIGSLFGLMQIKVGLMSILRDNTVEVCANTPIPVKISPMSFLLTPDGEIPLVFTKRF